MALINLKNLYNVLESKTKTDCSVPCTGVIPRYLGLHVNVFRVAHEILTSFYLAPYVLQPLFFIFSTTQNNRQKVISNLTFACFFHIAASFGYKPSTLNMQFILQEFYGSKTKFLQTIKSTVNCTMLDLGDFQRARNNRTFLA